jgi:hypothetical protein
MKKIFVVCCLFFLNFSIAQPFDPILDVDHVWSVDVELCPFGGGISGTLTHQVTLSGATVINGKTYMSVFNNNGESCLVREEGGVVYKYNSNLDEDIPIIDMNLELGEIFNVDLVQDYCSHGGANNLFFEVEVLAVTTEFIAGQDRKVIELGDPSAPWWNFKWIEGVGSDKGFDSMGETVDITCYTNLACFNDNGVITFFNGATACDNTNLAVPDHLKDQIVLAPNPVQDISILQLPSELNIDHIRIYDISGKLISEEKIIKDYTTINAMDYAAGLYFYQVLSENTVIKADRFVVK